MGISKIIHGIDGGAVAEYGEVEVVARGNAGAVTVHDDLSAAHKRAGPDAGGDAFAVAVEGDKVLAVGDHDRNAITAFGPGEDDGAIGRGADALAVADAQINAFMER